MVEQWSNDGGTVEQIWWNSGTVMEEQWNRYGGTIEQMVEQCKRDGETVEQ